jgi:hypothetical protein
MEAGSNTSTVAMRVVGGDIKGTLKSETVKYGPESMHWRRPAAIVNYRPILSSEGCYIRTMTTSVQLRKEKFGP